MKFGLIMGTQGDYLERRALCLVLVEWPRVEQCLINYLFFGLVFGSSSSSLSSFPSLLVLSTKHLYHLLQRPMHICESRRRLDCFSTLILLAHHPPGQAQQYQHEPIPTPLYQFLPSFILWKVTYKWPWVRIIVGNSPFGLQSFPPCFPRRTKFGCLVYGGRLIP